MWTNSLPHGVGDEAPDEFGGDVLRVGQIGAAALPSLGDTFLPQIGGRRKGGGHPAEEFGGYGIMLARDARILR